MYFKVNAHSVVGILSMKAIKIFFVDNLFIAVLSGVIAIAIWAFSPTLIKMTGADVGMSEFMFARYVICFFLFLPMIHTL